MIGCTASTTTHAHMDPVTGDTTTFKGAECCPPCEPQDYEVIRFETPEKKPIVSVEEDLITFYDLRGRAVLTFHENGFFLTHMRTGTDGAVESITVAKTQEAWRLMRDWLRQVFRHS
jgi:hypothetical protein